MGKPRGIALFLVLTILGIITTMLGAFMTLNHSNFSLLASSMEQAEAQQACLSGYNYALYRIEHDKSFGKEAFRPEDEVTNYGPLDSTLTCTRRSVSTLEYDITGTRMSFSITVLNNLPVSSRTGGSVDPDRRPGDFPDVAADALFLRVVGRSGRAGKRAEAVLHCAPAFDSSALSNGDLVIDQGSVVIDSNDKMRNFIKSNGTINLPRVSSNVRFQHTGDTASVKNPPFGYALARRTIRSGATDLGANTDALADANRDSKGFLSPKTPRKAEILNLDFGDIKLPDGATTSMPPGNYVFTTTKVNIPLQIDYEDADGNNQTDYKNLRITVPAIVRRNTTTQAVEKVWWSKSDISIPQDTDLWLPGYGGAKVTQLSGESLAESTPAQAVVGSDGNAMLADGVYANLWDSNIAVAAGYNVNIDGDFGVLYEREEQRGTVSEGPDGIDYPTWRDNVASTNDFKDATVYLGNAERGSSIKASGKMDLRAVSGRGAVLSHGDLSLNGTLQAEGEGVDAGGIALLSDHDVILKQPDRTSTSDAAAGRLTDTNFHGLVYAEHDFIVNQLVNENQQAVDRDLKITGSVVARQGTIRVGGTRTVNLTYDPKYLDDVVKDLSKNRIKLERYSFTFR